jgi:hypothetical protein
MPILLEDLIYQLPSDTAERVAKAKDRFNTRVREALRQETRLVFRRRDDPNEQHQKTTNVPISVVPGLPDTLQPAERQLIDDKFRLAILLAPHRDVLTALRDNGAAAVKLLIPALRKEPLAQNLLNGGEHHIESARDYADFILKKLSEFELTKFILRVDSDVLGVYRYRVHEYYDEPDPKIELYWGIIGLVARDLSVSVEELTCVVLAHELAHAYSHVGTDADDHSWGTGNFSKSQHELVEGLAQFYTLRVGKRLEESSPGVISAFDALLPHQPEAYHTHQQWKESTPEAVRLAMLETRRFRTPGTLEQFMACLDDAQKRMQL